MPAPSQVPGVVGAVPVRSPARIPVRKVQGGAGGAGSSGGGGFVARPLVGINIAFRSPALTDQPLWIRIDDPGS